MPFGVGLSGLTALALATSIPLGIVAILVALLSLGYDLTQPLLAGIVTDLPGDRGQATGLMAFLLFTGFGLGSLIFQAALPLGFSTVLATFGLGAIVAATFGLALFRRSATERLTRPVSVWMLPHSRSGATVRRTVDPRGRRPRRSGRC